jgi:malonyl-CoA O-methyltransferase
MKNYISSFNRALNWVRNNTIEDSGIAVTNLKQQIYPEVTGYYIPSLIQWGERRLARAYAEYLCSIQKEDGSWYDSDDSAPYVFDSAQILKGLLAAKDMLPKLDAYIIKGCDWILSNMQSDGRLTTPAQDAWGSNEDFCSELIHIYCLSPIRDAGKIYNRPDYLKAVEKILSYYKREKLEKIKNFSLLSHFYAYVMEGLYDLGEVDLCRESMMRLEKYRNRRGGIPGLNDVPWVCSTGLFQLALVWYKLGELDRGNPLFYYALSLQNSSGGWYGSYPAPGLRGQLYRGRKKPYYFPKEEISWANKYFMDALALKEQLEFERMAPIFMDSIDKNDGRYIIIRDEVASYGSGAAICDIGCGKGRYLKRLSVEHPENEYYAMDLSSAVMKEINYVQAKQVGRLTQIPYGDDQFDLVYVCEALEHAVNLQGAFMELYRIVKQGGKLVIIDKPEDRIGSHEIYEWEQWISDEDIHRFVQSCGGTLRIIKSVPYEGKNDGLFRAWIITKVSNQH